MQMQRRSFTAASSHMSLGGLPALTTFGIGLQSLPSITSYHSNLRPLSSLNMSRNVILSAYCICSAPFAFKRNKSIADGVFIIFRSIGSDF